MVSLAIIHNLIIAMCIGGNDNVRFKRDHHEASRSTSGDTRYSKGYSVNVTYSPEDNSGFFTEFFYTQNDQSCPVSTFVHFDDPFLPQWISLYSNCLAIKVFGANTFGLTNIVTFPSSATHWPSHPNTTVRVEAYNYNNYTVKLGEFIGIPNYHTSGSYLLLDVKIDGSITGTIYKASIPVYDTEVITDVTIGNELSFQTAATIYNGLDVIVKGKISTPSDIWEASTDIQFNTGPDSFFNKVESYMKRTLLYLASSSDARLNISEVNLGTVSSLVQSLQSTINTLQSKYNSSVAEYQEVLEIHENLVEQKNQKSTVFYNALNVDEDSVNQLCTETNCGQICQFSYDQSTCARDITLPINRTRQDNVASTESIRSSTNKAVLQCMSENRCELNAGIKWTQYSNGSLKLFPYNGVDCSNVCETISKNRTTYTDSIQPIDETTYSSFIQSWFNGKRYYTCSKVDNCMYKLNVEPCATSNQECDLQKKFQLINVASSTISDTALQFLLLTHQEYKILCANVSTARGEIERIALKVELYEQQLNITKRASESAQSIYQLLQNAHTSIESGVSLGIQIRDWIQNHLSVPDVLTLEGFNLSTQLPDTSRGDVQLHINYRIPYLAQSHLLNRQIDLTQPSNYLMEYITYEVIQNAINAVFDGKKRSITKREVVSLSTLDQFDANCQRLRDSIKHLTTINATLTAANSDNSKAISNITKLSADLEQQVNATIVASSSISNEYQIPLQQRKMLYLSEGQQLYNELYQTINSYSMIEWLLPIEMYYGLANYSAALRVIGGEDCYSFVDCLHVVSQYIFLDLVNIPNATTLYDLLPTVETAIRRLAENKQLPITEIQANIQTIYNVLWTIDQLNYWCSSKPTITVQPAPELPVATDPGTLMCTASSSLPVQYKWYKSNVLFSTNSTLWLSNHDSGNYQCQVRNDRQSIDSLISNVFSYQLPVITWHTRSAATFSGDESGIRLSCTATSYPLLPSWRWYYTGFTDNVWLTNLSTKYSNSLFISKPVSSSQGMYRCEAETEFGNVVSDPIPVYILSSTVAVYRYMFKFTIIDLSVSGGSGSGDTQATPDDYIPNTSQFQTIIMEELTLKLFIEASSIRNLSIQHIKGQTYFTVLFYLYSANITSDQTSTIETLSDMANNELWKLDQYRASTMKLFSQLTSFNDTFTIVNNSLTVNNREYICPNGNELHSNYLLCGKLKIIY